MNDVKSAAEAIGALCAKVAGMPNTDKRWSSIAQTDLQKGFMALVRSIARPTTF